MKCFGRTGLLAATVCAFIILLICSSAAAGIVHVKWDSPGPTFAGTETAREQRDCKTNVTVLDGNQAGSVVTGPVGATDTTVIDSFTTRNGSASYGGGIVCSGSSPTITNNTITVNTASENGGGISTRQYWFCCSPEVANNIVAFNSSGICNHDETPILRNNCVRQPAV